MKSPIIAIDGPSAAGKSTLGKRVAEVFAFKYIDTGAIYRVLAHAILENNTELDDSSAIQSIIQNLNIDFKMINAVNHVFLNGTDVSEKIRTPEISMLASKVSSFDYVRAGLLDMQRRFGKSGGIVLDGRDIGTVVFPTADVKIFLVATLDERAKRRYKELMEKHQGTTLQDVKDDIQKRDHQDSTRISAPLKKAEDAVELDTTNLEIEESLNRIMEIIKKKIKVG